MSGPAASLPELVGRMTDELAALDRAYSPGHQGLWLARRRSELVDKTLVELFTRANGDDGAPRAALAAQGGYGRGTLAPFSDLDLLLIHDGSDPGAVASLADALLYPLWDSGLRVGHAVRTPAECTRLAAERLDALTSSLDLRHLAGDATLVETTRAAAAEIASADPEAFTTKLRDAHAARRDRYGSVAHLLEPALKEGSGGLRDVHALGWLECAIGAPLEEVGLLRARERGAVNDAEEFLTRVRSALHLEAGKALDRLVLDHQPGIARAMGFADEPRLVTVDGLMRALFEHARQVEHVSTAVFERLLQTGSTTSRGAGPPSRPASPLDAASVLRALADVAEAGALASIDLLDAIEAADVAPVVEWTDGVRKAFVRLLRAGAAGAAALDSLDRLELLGRYLPEWTDVRCRPQRDPYHRFTVDAHLARAQSEMASLLAGESLDDPMQREAVNQIDDVEGALLGALLHDIGKNGRGAHVAEGARVARRALGRMRLPAPTRELATFMVEEHLLLPDTATRRDLTDEDLVLDVAARVGTSERLAALYLLAQADARATGPAAWTPWRQTLIRELVAKVQRVLDRGDMGTEIAERLTERIGRTRDLLADQPERELNRFIMRMPRGYFLSVDPASVARHFATVSPHLGTNEVRSAAQPGARAGTYELLVVAADRPGLLSWIAGALSLAGLSILTAQVFTTDDGVAVDLFEVEGSFEPQIGEDRWRRFRSVLRKTIEGRTSLEHRMDEQRAHYPPPPSDAAVTVAVDNDASDFFTVIEVGAPDRIGLLYDLTRTLAALGLDVHLAKVATYTGRVIDAFYVRDEVGRKVTEPERVVAVERSMRALLE